MLRNRVDNGGYAAGALEPGDRLGSRYEIVKLLGKGGMGAVYLARDLDLGRDVAMKLIAPHLANEGAVLERFKREIQLSSIVTHTNVLRVYDLGESEGLKFLTMQFIEGETLADLLARERPLPLDRMLPLFRQICDGLAAAHEKGVLHRDLKPQNVMLDAAGHVYLMDFGLATSRTMTAMTQAGAVMGTPQYMSPEQVKGTATDARSDIFSLGVMLYELLSGELPFTGDSLFEIMVKRTLGPPRPVGELKPSIPAYLQQMVDRCLATDPAQRYASMSELLADLDAGTVKAPIRKRRGPSRTALLLGGALVGVLALGVGGTMVAMNLTGSAAPPKPVMLLVGDFDNRTGEAVFNGTLEPALGTALEGASFLNAYNRGRALKLADSLKLEGAGLGEKRARLVAQREGIAVVTSGYVEREGSGYRVGVRAVDAFTGQRIVEQTEEVGDKEKALGAVTKLAARVRKKLGDKTPEGVQISAGGTVSAASLEAAHEYAIGTNFDAQGKWDDARRHFLEAVKLDPEMGRAYVGLGVLEANQGHRAEAQKSFEKAIAQVGRMSEREKYRVFGSYHLFMRDTDKAIEAYSQLHQQYPGDEAGLTNLAMAYGIKHDFAHALEPSRKAVELGPNQPIKRNNYGFALLFVGDYEGAIREQSKAIELSPTFINGYLGLGMAQLAGGQHDAAIETWKKLEALGPDGASAAAEGMADLLLHDGRLREARALLERGVATDLSRKDTDGAGRKLALLAEVHVVTGDARRAAATAKRAVETSGIDEVAYAAGVILASVGDDRGAVAIAEDFERKLAAEPQMYAKLVRGAIEMRRRNFGAAIEHYKAASQRLASWLAAYSLGRAYLESGAYAAAFDEFDRCEKRKGEAADVYQLTTPSYRYHAALLYHLGRAHEGLKSPAAAGTYQAFLAVKKSDEDPLVADARARLAKLAPATAPAAAK